MRRHPTSRSHRYIRYMRDKAAPPQPRPLTPEQWHTQVEALADKHNENYCFSSVSFTTFKGCATPPDQVRGKRNYVAYINGGNHHNDADPAKALAALDQELTARPPAEPKAAATETQPEALPDLPF